MLFHPGKSHGLACSSSNIPEALTDHEAVKSVPSRCDLRHAEANTSRLFCCHCPFSTHLGARPRSSTAPLYSVWGSRGEELYMSCTPPPTKSPLTHYVAVVSLSHEQHAANKVSGGHTLSAFAFPAGDKHRMKQKPQERRLCLPTTATGTPVTPHPVTRGCPKEAFLLNSIYLLSLCIILTS